MNKQSEKSAGTAAVVGGGVIGGGWAARFLLHGWTVNLYDPDPDAPRKIGEVLANARRSLPLLANVSMPAEGALRFVDSIAEAVADASWIQESVPERLDIKHRVFAEIFEAANASALIGSSTSGFKPSELQQGAESPHRILVAHPFNPVYLLPLIELVPGDSGTPESTAKAQKILQSIGMKPLVVRKEIDAHLADRFLEAVWREALWLINDDIATTEEIDDAIRYGFGLRWAQMGLFETYRIAGGEAGMEHFIAQFGPCLSWPWTKLMDVPELTDELTKKISSQSDVQSGQYTIRELERIRDDNLVGILLALKSNDWGAGRLLKEHDERMAAVDPVFPEPTQSMPDGWLQKPEPLKLNRGRVLAAWLDYNQHMTEARYFTVCSETNAILFDRLGIGATNANSGGNDSAREGAGKSLYAMETHMRHLSELNMADAWHTTTQVLFADDKRLRLIHCLYNSEDQRLAATCEQLFLHVDTKAKSACAFGDELAAKVNALQTAHADLPVPDGVGRYVGQPLG